MSIDREHKMGWIPSLSYFQQTTHRKATSGNAAALHLSFCAFQATILHCDLLPELPAHRTAMTVEKQTAPIQPQSELLHV